LRADLRAIFHQKLTAKLPAAEHAVSRDVFSLEGAGSVEDDTTMRIQTSAVLSLALVIGLSGSAVSATIVDQPTATQIQYGPYPDRRDNYYPQDRYYPNDRRDGYAPYPPSRGSYDAPLWRPGDVVPPMFSTSLSMIGSRAAWSARLVVICGFASDISFSWCANAIA
jgi:hypothetical protein